VFAATVSQKTFNSVSSQGGGRGTAPGDTLQGVGTRPKINILWLNLERTLDKRRGKMGRWEW